MLAETDGSNRDFAQNVTFHARANGAPGAVQVWATQVDGFDAAAVKMLREFERRAHGRVHRNSTHTPDLLRAIVD